MVNKYSRGNENLDRQKVSRDRFGKNLKRLVLAGAVVAATACFNTCGTSHVEEGLVYQNHVADRADGVNRLVFDRDVFQYNPNVLDLVVVGDPKGLEEGSFYDVTYKS
ncbi:MAG: hypothetical protein OEL87_02685, partial [Nanoarchaeota archaeon]|nr:hypothetical protein [Nanoarchaeota archaeon]